MKYFNILAVLLLSSSLTFYSCNENKESSQTDVPGIDDSTIEVPQTVAVDTLNATTTPAQPNATTLAEPAQNAAGVWHFTCPKGCAGGSGAAGNCTTCGGALAHNQAYHGQTNSMPAMNPMTTPAATTPATATPQQPEPAQNAAGVWHYTCAKGCAGGAGAPGNCATCGGALAHNQTYHQ